MATKTSTKKTTVKASAKKGLEAKTSAELQTDLSALRHDHQESKRSHKLGELVNPHVITMQRKQIARILTKINQSTKSEGQEDK